MVCNASFALHIISCAHCAVEFTFTLDHGFLCGPHSIYMNEMKSRIRVCERWPKVHALRETLIENCWRNAHTYGNGKQIVTLIELLCLREMSENYKL